MLGITFVGIFGRVELHSYWSRDESCDLGFLPRRLNISLGSSSPSRWSRHVEVAHLLHRPGNQLPLLFQIKLIDRLSSQQKPTSEESASLPNLVVGLNWTLAASTLPRSELMKPQRSWPTSHAPHCRPGHARPMSAEQTEPTHQPRNTLRIRCQAQDLIWRRCNERQEHMKVTSIRKCTFSWLCSYAHMEGVLQSDILCLSFIWANQKKCLNGITCTLAFHKPGSYQSLWSSWVHNRTTRPSTWSTYHRQNFHIDMGS